MTKNSVEKEVGIGGKKTEQGSFLGLPRYEYRHFISVPCRRERSGEVADKGTDVRWIKHRGRRAARLERYRAY